MVRAAYFVHEIGGTLESGSDPEVRDKNGMTLLHLAALAREE